MLNPAGTLVMVGGPNDGVWLGAFSQAIEAKLAAPFFTQRFVFILAEMHQSDLDVLRELLEAGKITPVIDRRYPLAERPPRCATSSWDMRGERSSFRWSSAMTSDSSANSGGFTVAIGIAPQERRAVMLAFLCSSVLMGSYYILRPVRDTVATEFGSRPAAKSIHCHIHRHSLRLSSLHCHGVPRQALAAAAGRVLVLDAQCFVV